VNDFLVELDIKVRVWLIEYKAMLERQAKDTSVPLMAKRDIKKANEITNFLKNKF
jgi:hypothetical protein